MGAESCNGDGRYARFADRGAEMLSTHMWCAQGQVSVVGNTRLRLLLVCVALHPALPSLFPHIFTCFHQHSLPTAAAAHCCCCPLLLYCCLCRKLSESLCRLFNPDAGFAAAGDEEAALHGLMQPGQQQGAADGVVRACFRAAMAHKLWRDRLLPRVKVGR